MQTALSSGAGLQYAIVLMAAEDRGDQGGPSKWSGRPSANVSQACLLEIHICSDGAKRSG